MASGHFTGTAGGDLSSTEPKSGVTTSVVPTMIGMDDLMVPVSIEPIYAWRVWKILSEPPVSTRQDEQAGNLVSAIQCYIWPPREAPPAVCQNKFIGPHRDEVSPGASCQCGYYASRDYDHMVQQGYCETRHSTRYARIVGIVALWGVIEECEHGFKGQFAYPQFLMVPLGFPGFVGPLRERYGVRTRMMAHSKSLPPVETLLNDKAWAN